MSFLTPHFWYPIPGEKRGWKSTILMPLSWAYQMGRRIAVSGKKPYAVNIPVLCVGNVIAGGAGKTPTSLALMALIQTHEIAKAPYFLTRGHGGALKNAALVDPEYHHAGHVGDEALLLARHAPVIRAANRPLGAVMAVQDGADFIVMDDGFQNPSLHKDIGLIVIDGAVGFGNGRLLPAGPLRESVESALSRAQGVVLIGEDAHGVRASIPDNIPVFEAQIEPVSKPKGKSYIGFCGLGRPAKFFSLLRELGVNMLEEHSYPDHYNYTQGDMDYLSGRAKESGAALITTEKDAVKLSGLQNEDMVETLAIQLRWKDEGAVLAFLRGALS